MFLVSTAKPRSNRYTESDPKELENILLCKINKYSKKKTLNRTQVDESLISEIRSENGVTKCMIKCPHCDKNIPCSSAAKSQKNWVNPKTPNKKIFNHASDNDLLDEILKS